MTGLAAMPRYEVYKDSGVEWLGEIPEHWEIKRLRFLTSIRTGDKNTEDKQDDGLYPFLDWSQKFLKENKLIVDAFEQVDP